MSLRNIHYLIVAFTVLLWKLFKLESCLVLLADGEKCDVSCYVFFLVSKRPTVFEKNIQSKKQYGVPCMNGFVCVYVCM